MVDASGHSIHIPSVVSDKKFVPSPDDQLDNVHSTCTGSHDQLSYNGRGSSIEDYMINYHIMGGAHQ